MAAGLVNDPATHMTDGSPKSGLPVDLVGTPIKLNRVSYGRFEAATMQAEVSELTPFETSIKMGLNDSTTK